jgi:general secretion pathway protein L
LFKRTIALQSSAEPLLQAAASPWDLAQFDLVNSSRTRTFKRWSALATGLLRAPRWRAARLALVALLAVNLIGLNAWAWKERSSLKAQRLAIDAVLSTTFPQVQVVVDAPFQMAREVAALQQASGVASARDLESMLAAFGAVAPAGTVPGALDYVAGELRLKGLTLQPEDVGPLSFQLKPLGYAATSEGDSLVIKQVSGL